MHMADALLSPAVGGTLWIATLGLIAHSTRRVKGQLPPTERHSASIALAGVLGAFVFAAQMVNFSIPGTGSSGHLGGGLLLAVLLGPHLGFITIAAILALQAFLFADGGILALGCNIFNMGFFAAFIALPLVFLPLRGNNPSRKRTIMAAVAASLVTLTLGAGAVVVETASSGITQLPVWVFAGLMIPIHLAIGVVEGLVTGVVIAFVEEATPQALANHHQTTKWYSLRRPQVALAIAAVAVGGIVSWFASSHPDGLEWSIENVAGTPELNASSSTHAWSAKLQESTALLPDYGFKTDDATGDLSEGESDAWPAVDPGTSTSGLLGAILILCFMTALGWILRRSSHQSTTT